MFRYPGANWRMSCSPTLPGTGTLLYNCVVVVVCAFKSIFHFFEFLQPAASSSSRVHDAFMSNDETPPPTPPNSKCQSRITYRSSLFLCVLVSRVSLWRILTRRKAPWRSARGEIILGRLHTNTAAAAAAE